MKITKSQLRKIIRETIGADDRDFSAPPGEEDYYASGGEGERKRDMQLKAGWGRWLEERGLSFEDLDELAQFTGAPNRTWLHDSPPADGMIGPADIEMWAKDQRAAREILSTRMGDYSSSPHGKKMNEGVDPRGLKTMLKKLGVTRSYGGVTDALSQAFYDFEGDAADMKEEVEVMSGGYRDDAGNAINWPLDIYQQIHDLYSKQKASYRAPGRY